MQELWTYYVCYAVQVENRLGLSAKVVELDHRIDSEVTVIGLINALVEEVFPDGVPDEFRGTDRMPLIPLNWVLVNARRSSPKDNGKKRPH